MIDVFLRSLLEQVQISERISSEVGKIYDRFEESLGALYSFHLLNLTLFVTFTFSILMFIALSTTKYLFSANQIPEGLVLSSGVMSLLSLFMAGIFTVIQKSKSRRRKESIQKEVQRLSEKMSNTIISTLSPSGYNTNSPHSQSSSSEESSEERLSRIENAILLLIEEKENSIKRNNGAQKKEFTFEPREKEPCEGVSPKSKSQLLEQRKEFSKC